jgi:hypothetical protein
MARVVESILRSQVRRDARLRELGRDDDCNRAGRGGWAGLGYGAKGFGFVDAKPLERQQEVRRRTRLALAP